MFLLSVIKLATRKISLRFIGVWAILAIIIICISVTLIKFLVIAYSQVCINVSHHITGNCTSYDVVILGLKHFARSLNQYGGLLTVLVTAAIAFFNWRLYESTEKLWNSGERQFTHAKESNKKQLRAYVFPATVSTVSLPIPVTHYNAAMGIPSPTPTAPPVVHGVAPAPISPQVETGSGRSGPEQANTKSSAQSTSSASDPQRATPEYRAFPAGSFAVDAPPPRLTPGIFPPPIPGCFAPDSNGSLVSITVTVKNSGLTPAHRFRGWFGCGVERYPPPELNNPDETFKNPIAVMGPGTSLIFSHTLYLRKELVQEIKESKKALYVFGKIEYVDVFGDPQHTYYKLECVGSKADTWDFHFCMDGNEET